MRPYLMFKRRPFEMRTPDDLDVGLIRDLGLESLFEAMSAGERRLLDVARSAFLDRLEDPDEILYRQEALQDGIRNEGVLRSIYAGVTAAIEKENKRFHSFASKSPSGLIRRALDVLPDLLDCLTKVRDTGLWHRRSFRSDAFLSFFKRLEDNLNDAYIRDLDACLSALHFRDGLSITMQLGGAYTGTAHHPCPPDTRRWATTRRLFAEWRSSYVFYLHPRDESGYRACVALRDRGLASTARTLNSASENLQGVLHELRDELAFYLGCINLRNRLMQAGAATSFPLPRSSDRTIGRFEGLYDAALALRGRSVVVLNDLCSFDTGLVVITGANQGGKSTFLRSVGIGQMMMQAGMFVPATFYSAGICRGIFAHFKREEDTSLKSGKFDEELSRMSAIVERLRSGSMLLLNESFAATNEKEGSETASGIVRALLERGVVIVFVTHLFEFPSALYAEDIARVRFLRAERREDGSRSFKIIDGAPLRSSHAKDLFDRFFADSAA